MLTQSEYYLLNPTLPGHNLGSGCIPLPNDTSPVEAFTPSLLKISLVSGNTLLPSFLPTEDGNVLLLVLAPEYFTTPSYFPHSCSDL